MKTVSDITTADILCYFRPEHPTLAIVDTQICPVEQIIMLKAVDEDNVPEQAFVVNTAEGSRYVECDSRSTNWNGTAMLISNMTPYITPEQLRFLTKNTITSLKDDYNFDTVVDSITYQLKMARRKGICDVGSHYSVGVEGHCYIDYMRSLCNDLREEIRQEVEDAQDAADNSSGDGTGANDTTTNP